MAGLPVKREPADNKRQGIAPWGEPYRIDVRTRLSLTLSSMSMQKKSKPTHRRKKAIEVRFMDHIIIGRAASSHTAYYSFKEAGLL